MVKRMCIKDFNYRDIDSWKCGMVYIGRNNVSTLPKEIKDTRNLDWGNIYVMKTEADRINAVKSYRKHLWEMIKEKPETISYLKLLKNKTLVCWCKEHQLCHGDIIIKAVNYYVNN